MSDGPFPKLFRLTIRWDQLPALNDALCCAIESMSEEAEADPEIASDFRAVMALRDSFQQQLNDQRAEQPTHQPGNADGLIEPRS